MHDCVFSYLFFFLWPNPRHMKVPWLQLKPMLKPEQHQIWATSVTYTTAGGNAKCLTHWARPGMEPTASWTLRWVFNLLSHNRNLYFLFCILPCILYNFIFYFLFLLYRAASTAYGGSQARGPIRAAAASQHHSHSNAESEPCLRPTPQLTATLDP